MVNILNSMEGSELTFSLKNMKPNVLYMQLRTDRSPLGQYLQVKH